jgi:hypothetical protein
MAHMATELYADTEASGVLREIGCRPPPRHHPINDKEVTVGVIVRSLVYSDASHIVTHMGNTILLPVCKYDQSSLPSN